MLELRIYLTREGKAPFPEWLGAMRDAKVRAVIRARLARVRLGNLGDCKPVGQGVNELRIDFGPGYRVYFGREKKALVVLLCGGEKKSQARDIERAVRFWADYRSREDA